VQSSIARAWSLVDQPARERPIACFLPPMSGAVGVGMQLNDRAVQRQRVPVPRGRLLGQQRGEDALQHTRLGSAVEPHVDRVPRAEALRHRPPLEPCSAI